MSILGAQTANAPKFDGEAHAYDGLLVMSFGGPEGMEDVLPFLENVTQGRGIPRERLAEVGSHYANFNGISPINAQNRALIAALEVRFNETGLALPIYFGNRNWHPFVTDTIRQMQEDGVKRALVFVTSAFSSYSGCRQYREDILRACEAVKDAPCLDKIRVFYNHPGFILPNAENLQNALNQFPAELRANVPVVFTAHSIPMAMARQSDYQVQLEEACRLVAEQADVAEYALVYQSRSGAPQIPWLEPDILAYMETLATEGVRDLVLHPIGFISDHMEVLHDLDTEAIEKACKLGIRTVRSATVGTHPTFVSMIHELVLERITAEKRRRALGVRGPNHDICPMECCLKG